ncbi:MAG TPA: FAD-binding oxidoreductase [Woeseiaceae bacterium]|nr:FAD-binding oxidoreductase [Woeseiaceae bacterium]
MPQTTDADVIIVGAGIAGIATAHHLACGTATRKVVLVDALPPMSFTSAESGENYRNWWPHSIMTGFIDRSTDLLQGIARDSANRINLTHRGYALATREDDISGLLESLKAGYGADQSNGIRIRDRRDAANYLASLHEVSAGVDVLTDTGTIRRAFPAFDPGIRYVVHIRRAGDLDSYQLSQYLLERFRARGGSLLHVKVAEISRNRSLQVRLSDGQLLSTPRLVIAAGPFVNELLAHLGERLPVHNVLQQKLGFEDVLQTIPKEQPFAVDLDPQLIDWSEEERALLAAEADFRHLAGVMPGKVHRRIDSSPQRRTLELGWAYNKAPCEPVWEPVLDETFPEIVLRGAARLNPGLKGYYDRLPPTRVLHGGYYTMTDENLPIIGPLPTEGVFVVAALSGFGTMAACAAGELCAAWIDGAKLPAYGKHLSLERYTDAQFMAAFSGVDDRGVL